MSKQAPSCVVNSTNSGAVGVASRCGMVVRRYKHEASSWYGLKRLNYRKTATSLLLQPISVSRLQNCISIFTHIVS